MPLTDLQIKATKEGEKLVKLTDGGGLQLWVTPDKAKRWRFAYRFGGKQKALALGVYPRMGLKDARSARDEAKDLLAAGTDPSEARKFEKHKRAAADTFAAIADELIEKKRAERKAEATIAKSAWLLGLAKSAFGGRPVREITPPEILTVLRSFEAKAQFETASRLRAIVGEAFRYAVATGRTTSDPTRDLKGAIAAPKPTPRAAIIEPQAFGELLRTVADYHGAPETRIALELLALTFVRPGELRSAEWSEFDLDAAIWTISASKMKMRRPHKVPLSRRAVELLHELRGIVRQSRYLFPSLRSADRPMSENTLNAALRRLGYKKDEMTAHGFRAAASSILNESGLVERRRNRSAARPC
jgi:integrase